MSHTQGASNRKSVQGPPQRGLMDDLVDNIIRAINDADDKVVLERVANLRAAQPEASADALVEWLIKQKCLQTGAVGAITSGAALIPGGGSLITLTFGVAADLTLTLKMQAELVLEIATVYQRRLSRLEKRQVIIMLLGMGVASDRLLNQAGTIIAQKATERLAEKTAEKAFPVLGVAASAGKNILTTYIVGQRAQAYFSLGPEAVGDWSQSIQVITGVDAQKIIGWLVETTERSWQLVSHTTQSITVATIVAGQAIGEVLVLQVDQAGRWAVKAGRGAVQRAGQTTKTMVDVGRKVGQEASTGISVAGRIAAGAGRSVTGGAKTATSQASTATQKLVSVFHRNQETYPGSEIMYDIEDIPNISDQSERIEAITVDCYDQSEELSAFEVYFTDVMQFPFAATWRDPDEPGHAESVTVLDVDRIDERRGVLLQVQRGDKQRRVLAEQLWPDDENSANATILNDYRYWVNELNGLTPGYG